MRRSPRTRPSRRSPLVAALAVAAGLLGAPALGSPAGGQVIVDPADEVVLEVSPSDRTAVGVELTLTATVERSGGGPLTEGAVTFAVDGEEVAVVDVDEAGRAVATTTPSQGAHRITASHPGTHDTWGGIDERVHSVLPATCADQATPGAGAVVRLAYRAVLDRCPDAAGFAYWSDRIAAGASSAALGRGLAVSAEGVAATVDTAYATVLGRPADAGGRAVWAAKLRSGWTTSQLWAALAASPEMTGGSTDPGTRVDIAFTRILGRAADAGGRAYWRSRLEASGPSATLRALALTSEALGRVVDDAHRATLGRAATPTEQGDAQARIRARRGDWRTLVAELLGTEAASAHAQTYPDPAG